MKQVLLVKRKTFEIYTLINYNSENIVEKVTIRDSYKYLDKTDQKAILNTIFKYLALKNLTYSRSFSSCLREWRAHNLLYKLNIRRSSTKDVDLDITETKFRIFCYYLLGI